MGTPIKNVTSLPDYALHRIVKEANDGATISEHGWAMNAATFKQVAIQVVPSGTANPSIEVLFWSVEAAKFISAHVPIVYAGKGADVPYEAVVDAQGREIFVTVTAGMAAGRTAKIFVGGCPN
jgi:hypothetical protein